jgi:hypothetical protein
MLGVRLVSDLLVVVQSNDWQLDLTSRNDAAGWCAQ